MMFGVIFASLGMCPSVKRGCKPRLRSRCVLPVGAVSNRAYQRGLANGGRGPVPRQTHARPSIARDRPSHYGQPRGVHSTPLDAVSNRAYQRGLANGGRRPVPRQTHARPSIARDRPSHYGQPRDVHSTLLGAVSNRAYQRGLANGGRGPVPRQTHARPSIATDRPSHYGQPRSVHSTPQTHPIFDVVVDDEVQLLIREAVVLRQHTIDLVDNRFGVTRRKFVIDDAARSFILCLLSPCVLFQIRH